MAGLEDAVIDLIRTASRAVSSSQVRFGIGDDTAVLRSPRAGRELLLTTDQIIENTHFVMGRHAAKALGHKTLVRGLSDIAAMGGSPLCFLLSLSLPESLGLVWLKQYIDGMFRASKTHGAPCVGGDVARSGHFSAAITVVGDVPRGKALMRTGARPGDLLFVSGSLGGSALGLSRLLASSRARGAAVERHLFPGPRLTLGRLLREKLKATAAMDLSDGLSTDLARLALASKVKAEVDADAIPVFPGASAEQALHGGEEYELLFTVRPGRRVPALMAGVRLSCIGRILPGRGVGLKTARGTESLEPGGFQHFRR
jgi:thiamine-monophosphate kinase